MIKFITGLLLLIATPVFAAGTFSTFINNNTKYLNYSGCAGTTTTNTGTGNSLFLIQGSDTFASYKGGAPSPNDNYLITSDYSETLSTTSYSWLTLIYSGSGTCIVRLMSTNVKANFPAIPVNALGLGR